MSRAILAPMGSSGGETKDQIFSDLQLWQRHCFESSQSFLSAAERCRNRDPGNDTVNNLKIATILQEIALQKYQRTVDALSERLKLDKPGASAKP
jgi:hypothetical protein